MGSVGQNFNPTSGYLLIIHIATKQSSFFFLFFKSNGLCSVGHQRSSSLPETVSVQITASQVNFGCSVERITSGLFRLFLILKSFCRYPALFSIKVVSCFPWGGQPQKRENTENFSHPGFSDISSSNRKIEKDNADQNASVPALKPLPSGDVVRKQKNIF